MPGVSSMGSAKLKATRLESMRSNSTIMSGGDDRPDATTACPLSTQTPIRCRSRTLAIKPARTTAADERKGIGTTQHAPALTIRELITHRPANGS